MGNSIVDKNWSGSNESLSKFMENAKTNAKIMDRQRSNKSMKDLLEKNNENENEEKSSIVVRWYRTIKRNMWKYFSANNPIN